MPVHLQLFLFMTKSIAAKISLPTAAALVVANMVGTGVFTTLGFQVIELHSATTILLLWLIGGVAAFCGAMVYGALSANFPRSGGEYHLLSQMYHPAVGCMAGFVSVTVGFAAPTALSAMAFGKYLQGALGKGDAFVLSIGIVLAITGVHLLGSRRSAVFQNFFTALKICLVLGIAFVCWHFGSGDGMAAYREPSKPEEIFSAPFAVALVYVMFAYSGWNAAVYLAGEVRDPERNVPRALLIGTAFVIFMYVAVNAAFLYAVPREEIAGQVEVGLIAGKRVFGDFGGRLVGGLISVGLVSAISAMIWAGPRVAMAMGEDLPGMRWLARRNRDGTPWAATVLQVGIALALLITSTFEAVLLWTQATLLWCSLFAVAGLFWSRIPLRAIRPRLKFCAVVYLGITAWMIFYLFVMKPTESIAALLVLAAGLLVYAFGRRGGAAALLLFLYSGTAVFAQDINQTARLLAGMPVTDPALEAITRNRPWHEHAESFEAAWAQRTGPQIQRVTQWAAAELGSAYASRLPVFYFFSGPDFLYANAIYPSAQTYVLCGKEPVGSVPDMAKLAPEQWDAALENLKKSLKTILHYSFFITEDMKTDLRSTELTGVLPILYVFLARTGKEITKVGHIQSGGLNGVRIDFRGQGGDQALYYFSGDLSNSGIKANSAVIKFCAALGEGNSFLKSASYLPHMSEFSRVRDFLLDHSQVIVEDDSGIPVRYFDAAKWQVRVFGNYVGPIPIFQKHHQPDLAQRYAISNPKPLDFGMGYRFQPQESAILVAFKKQASGL